MKILDNLRKNTIILMIITIIVLFFVLKDDFYEIITSLSHINLVYVLLALLFFLLSIVLKGYVNYLIIDDQEKVNKREAIKQNFISQFFNGITPFSTGGEPMGVYMLVERGISLPKATNNMVQSFIFYQVALVICGTLAVIYNFIFQIFPKIQLLQKLVLLGFIINIIVVLLLLLTYSAKATHKMSQIVIKILKVLRINVKEEEVSKKFDDYYKSFQVLKQKKGLIIIGITLNIISLFCLYLVPYWIVCGMRDTSQISIIETLVSSAYVYLIGAFVPIPGASGGIEYGFAQFFGNFIEAPHTSAILIVWRFITYYLGIIIGAILFNIRKKENQ